MLTKFCPYPGCSEIIPANERYCPKHMAMYLKQYPQAEAEWQRRYDATVRHARDADITAFYHSPEWSRLQPVVLARYHGLDLWAYYIGHEIVSAEMVHHIKPVRTNWDDRFSVCNLIPLSGSNHGMVERLYKTGEKKATQKQLLELLGRWKKEFGTRGW